MHLQIVDCNIIDASNIINILKYVMKKHKILFGIVKWMFIVLLASIVYASNYTKCVSSIKNKRFNLLLLIYILINTVKNFTNIHCSWIR